MLASSKLQSNSSVILGGRTFELGKELGRGAFGSVLEAVEIGNVDGKAVAVKVSKVNGTAGFRLLVTEFQVLRRLNHVLSREGAEDSLKRVPRYIAHSFGPSEVTFAMTKAQGRPLDEWLYGSDSGSSPGSLEGRARSFSFVRSCRFAAALLSQMAPVFSALQPIAFHRDISDHNFFVDVSGGDDDPHFTIIDFGLAVEAAEWKGHWRTMDIGGDPRYWSPAHLSQFCIGAEEMEQKEPAFARLCQERLDHYSFGVLLLELVFGLWDGSSDGDHDLAGVLDQLVGARVCWQTYWSLTNSLAGNIQHGKSDLSRLHDDIVASGLQSAFATAHQKLSQVLRSAAGANFSGQAATEIVPLLATAADLMDPSSTVSWVQLPEVLSGGTSRVLPSSDATLQHQPVGREPTACVRNVAIGEPMACVRDVPTRRSLPNRAAFEARCRASNRTQAIQSGPSPPQCKRSGTAAPPLRSVAAVCPNASHVDRSAAPAKLRPSRKNGNHPSRVGTGSAGKVRSLMC